jgi:hypothetical protein
MNRARRGIRVARRLITGTIRVMVELSRIIQEVRSGR